MKTPEILVVDNYLPNPDAVRAFALTETYADSVWYKGRRSQGQHFDTVNKADFERLLGLSIPDFSKHGMNARFQYCIGGDQLVYHSDMQSHAAVLYLTPDAPPEAGTSFWRSKKTGVRRSPSDPALINPTYEGNLLDETKWDLIDRVGNVYNRLVIWDGLLIHSASQYFGNSLENGRLFQIFFFDAE